MNPRAVAILFRPKNRRDARTPERREDEMPLHFLVSNSTYRLVMAGDRLREKLEEIWLRYKQDRTYNP